MLKSLKEVRLETGLNTGTSNSAHIYPIYPPSPIIYPICHPSRVYPIYYPSPDIYCIYPSSPIIYPIYHPSSIVTFLWILNIIPKSNFAAWALHCPNTPCTTLLVHCPNTPSTALLVQGEILCSWLDLWALNVPSATKQGSLQQRHQFAIWDVFDFILNVVYN